jgi:DNA gyrase subunit B
LLLTFFYRQMPELIERGHIYIGQPPLYKIKLGKQEHYLKDDTELNEYLLARALDNAALRFDPDSPPLQGEALEQLMRDFIAVQSGEHPPGANGTISDFWNNLLILNDFQIRLRRGEGASGAPR